MPQGRSLALQQRPFHAIRAAPMHIRTRKFIGGFLILAVLVVYSLIAMVIGAAVAIEWPEAGRVAFYAAAGLLWLPLVMVIIRWMARPT
jgi:NADH:ubiquinone oxidoreductase subunit 3 (subunit A)